MSAITPKSNFGVAQVILFLSIAILVIVVAVPVLLIFFNAFWVDGKFNASDVVKILSEPETYQALKNSLIIASMTTIGSTIVGTFFAWLVTRTDLPYKGFMKAMFLVPFMLPSFIGALAWKMLLSPNAGFINKFFISHFGFDGPVFNIYSYIGISGVEVMYLFPFVFIQVCGALERMDPTLEESARISGAGLFTITRKITIPLVLPSILSGSLLIMLYSMAHFGTVAVLGIENGIFNIPTLIYERIHQSGGSFDAIRTGTVLATVLVITAAFIIWLQGKVLGKGHYQIIGGKSFRPMELKLRALRVPLLIFCLIYIAFTIVLPTAVIFLVGGLKTYGLPFTWDNLSLANYKYILFDYNVTRDAIWNSVTLGLSAAVITMFAGVMISYVIVKMKVRGKRILEFLGMLPFSVPGSVIALGVILAWSGQFGINLYNTVWIILVAYIARYMAFSLKANSAALEQVHDSLVEAARSCGASMWQSLKDIVLPLVRPGMLAAFFLIFLPSLRELTVSIMLYAPTTRTIGVAIYTLNEDGETVVSAALAGVALIIIIVGQTLINRFTRKVGA
ncbi:ABC transporter permease [Sporomusa acidovorans]|uniref:ABC transmembrane type-1 domain-containing protein n=1 Tax=Sporomusa acidovorans (strain ATCC 49682 / DSM 3132 / Mol) TaxID=1123286 RepID=A0ABZ3J9V6_SPOA4|nr:iron ABC transporter permease [Sporomusa acidovorans]OZC16258.1 putative 2-aminoethylphosphonate transport system permease protein PhnV [Sporomusa acidovorans DSM 3132]SDE32891.1 iron(III) transport system permease protein [Sporomusa acidovorans]